MKNGLNNAHPALRYGVAATRIHNIFEHNIFEHNLVNSISPRSQRKNKLLRKCQKQLFQSKSISFISCTNATPTVINPRFSEVV